MGTGWKEKEERLSWMQHGGLTVMLSGAGGITGIVLGVIFENMGLMIASGIAGIVGLLLGLVVWGSGWMMRED